MSGDCDLCGSYDHVETGCEAWEDPGACDRLVPTVHPPRSARRRAPRAWLNRLVAFRAEHNRQGVCCRG